MVVINIYKYFFENFKNVLTKKFKNEIVRVNLRGGVLMNYSFFPLSDIDTSIILNDYQNINHVREHLINQKKKNPFFKEYNVYVLNDLKIFGKHSNYYEIQKDEYLKINCEVNENPYDKIVFSIKTIIANQNKGSFCQRGKKWNFYSQNVQYDVCNNLSEFTVATEKFYNLIVNDSGRSFKARFSIFCIKKLDPVISLPIWLENCFKNCIFDEELSGLSKLSHSEQMIILSQINWEIFGLIGQFFTISKENNFLEHASNLRKVLDHLDKIKHEKDAVLIGLNKFTHRSLELKPL